MDRPVRLNWGCGPMLPRGWINSDVAFYEHSGGEQHHQGDILDGLPWPDDHFDGIVANHSLQSLCAHELGPAVRELRRVLSYGGRLRVIVPDIIAAFYAWEAGDERWGGFFAISEDWSLDRKFAHYLTWGGQNRTTFTEDTLIGLLEGNGFERVFPVIDTDDIAWASFAWLRELDSRLGESIIVEVKKP